jgi:hypothetical protein
MAILAVVLSLNEAKLRHEANREVCEERFFGELGILNARGLAFGALNGPFETFEFGV